MSAIQSDREHPERCVIDHPFNPPHIIPLVEVVGGTSESFFVSVGSVYWLVAKMLRRGNL